MFINNLFAAAFTEGCDIALFYCFVREEVFYDKKKEPTGRVLVFSENQMLGIALKSYGTNPKENILVVCVLDDVIGMLEEYEPDYVILDIAPHRNAFFLYKIRCRFSSMPVICIQKNFLFSDRISAEFFGTLWLMTYDHIPDIYRRNGLEDMNVQDMFFGQFSSSVMHYNNVSDSLSEPELLYEMNNWLTLRLAGIIPSSRIRAVAVEWLVKGKTVAETGHSININDKVIYSYRRAVMKALGMKSYAREFIPSLKF